MWKNIFRWLKVIILIYCGAGIALYYLQDLILFHPVALPAGYQYQFNGRFEEINVPLNNTDTINVVKFFPAGTLVKGVVLYYHGNKENVNRYAKFAENFTRNGYEVWMEDYQGFGKSKGQRNEETLYSGAWQVYLMARNRFSNDSIIVYGKSFGTGIAANVSSKMVCKHLILESPYYSIPALYKCYLPIYPTGRMSHYKMPVNEFLLKVRSPVTIFHGTNDGVIPYSLAAELKPFLKPVDEFIPVKKGRHNDLNDFREYHQALDSLLK